MKKGTENMARSRQVVSIDEKIAAAQENAERSKARYDAAVAELKKLMEKKEAMKKQVLINAITGSKRSYDEILEFLKGDAEPNDN